MISLGTDIVQMKGGQVMVFLDLQNEYENKGRINFSIG